MWYVNVHDKDGIIADGASFILTMWYVNILSLMKVN